MAQNEHPIFNIPSPGARAAWHSRARHGEAARSATARGDAEARHGASPISPDGTGRASRTRSEHVKSSCALRASTRTPVSSYVTSPDNSRQRAHLGARAHQPPRFPRQLPRLHCGTLDPCRPYRTRRSRTRRRKSVASVHASAAAIRFSAERPSEEFPVLRGIQRRFDAPGPERREHHFHAFLPPRPRALRARERIVIRLRALARSHRQRHPLQRSPRNLRHRRLGQRKVDLLRPPPRKRPARRLLPVLISRVARESQAPARAATHPTAPAPRSPENRSPCRCRACDAARPSYGPPPAPRPAAGPHPRR